MITLNSRVRAPRIEKEAGTIYKEVGQNLGTPEWNNGVRVERSREFREICQGA